MKYRGKPTALTAIFSFLFLLLLSPGISRAQESLNSGAGNATGSGGTVSYSIGQVLYSNHTGSSGSEMQGVQQPFEVFLVGNSAAIAAVSLSVFPNPAVESLRLQAGEAAIGQLRYQLWDTKGKMLAEELILEADTRIGMAGLPSAAYILKVLDLQNTENQTFKIIKK